jgi:hypothetical protein
VKYIEKKGWRSSAAGILDAHIDLTQIVIKEIGSAFDKKQITFHILKKIKKIYLRNLIHLYFNLLHEKQLQFQSKKEKFLYLCFGFIKIINTLKHDSLPAAIAHYRFFQKEIFKKLLFN